MFSRDEPLRIGGLFCHLCSVRNSVLVFGILEVSLLAIVLVTGKVCPKYKGLEPERVQASDDQRVVIEDGGT